MIKILTFGVFDFFHYGHLKLFERCKSYGDYLIVAVQIGSEIHKRKPTAKVLYTTEQRIEMVSAIKYVNKVVESIQVDEDIKHIDFDILIVGEDQDHDGFKRAVEYCECNGKKVVRLSRTPGICSSEIKNKIFNYIDERAT